MFNNFKLINIGKKNNFDLNHSSINQIINLKNKYYFQKFELFRRLNR